jgi:hypothetical protein
MPRKARNKNPRARSHTIEAVGEELLELRGAGQRPLGGAGMTDQGAQRRRLARARGWGHGRELARRLRLHHERVGLGDTGPGALEGRVRGGGLLALRSRHSTSAAGQAPALADA